MSRSTGIETALRVIAAAASERRPLPPELRARCGALGETLASALERGEDLPTAFAGLLPEELRVALRGPRPPLERSALLAAERLRLERAARLAWFDALAHPALTVVGVTVAMVVVGRIGGLGLSLPWLVAAAAVLVVGGLLTWLARSRGLSPLLPSLAALGHHARQAERYERAALVARWRLPEAEIAPLLGADLAGLGPVLADAQAELHCRRLAEHHAGAATRARARLAWTLGAVIYVAAGALLLAAAAQPMTACVEAMMALGAD
jgi:hypothetical protein